jgi:hypothetical protein
MHLNRLISITWLSVLFPRKTSNHIYYHQHRERASPLFLLPAVQRRTAFSLRGKRDSPTQFAAPRIPMFQP